VGVPGPPGRPLTIGPLPEHVKRLGGFIARSHNLDLRFSADYLNSKAKLGARRDHGVHPAYLMSVVRIADYLQIQPKRAPAEVLQVRGLKSPVSRGEWSAHAAISDIHQEDDDPEAIWVEAAPQNVGTYLKLKYLLADIQRELAMCWAVIGEVYGPKEDLRRLSLSVRRIKSNLDDTKAFSRTVDYIPVRAVIETAGPELLKLLVRPLYGDRPEIGVRELMQNAVDACRELTAYAAAHPNLGTPELTEQEADVVIALEEREDGTEWLTVSDRGIGMTVDTILNYFLKAGATLRASDAWRKEFEDQEGHTKVLISGRFGIGVLAGFLLGDEILVSTRHVSESRGTQFKCAMGGTPLQLTHTKRPVGTTVEVRLGQEAFSELMNEARKPEPTFRQNWDWYCLSLPSVRRVLLPSGRTLGQCYTIPPANATLNAAWRRLAHPAFADIHWTYSRVPALACNGIAVRGRLFAPRDHLAPEGLMLPKISVFDPDGQLPLTLQRDSIEGQYPFQKELAEDVYRDFIAYLITNAPVSQPSIDDQSYTFPQFRYPGARMNAWCWYSPLGTSVLDPWNVAHSKLARLFLINCSVQTELDRVIDFDSALCFAPTLFSVDEPDGSPDWVPGYSQFDRFVAGRELRSEIVWKGISSIEPAGMRVLTKHYGDVWRHAAELRGNDWYLRRDEDCPELDFDPERVAAGLLEEGSIAVWYFKWDSPEPKPQSRFNALWRDIIGPPHIPYDLNARRKRLAGAYKELAEYIASWEAIKNREGTAR
ncbi:MAG: HD domain-containing protein, partial [Blastocatellia bacterium]